MQVTLVVVVGALLFFVVRVSKPEARRIEDVAAQAAVELRLGLDDMRSAIARAHLARGTWPGLGDGPGVVDVLRGELGGLPRNPWNGSRSVRVLPPGAPWPAEVDGKSGWIYRPSTGEIRANVPLAVVASGVRLYDL